MRTLPPPTLTPQLVEKFFSNITVNDRGCWLRGPSSSRASFSIKNSSGKPVHYTASSISFQIHTGRYPSLFMCHTCDDPRCVNPDHLFEGTAKDNSQDMMRKGRGGQGRHKVLYRS